MDVATPTRGKEDNVRSLALLIGLVVTAVGVVGIVVPDALIVFGRHAATPVGLYLVAVVRVGIGLVLVRAARAARTPTALRVLGGIIFISGLITPFFGADRARAVLDWWSAHGSAFLRLWSVVAVVLGLFIMYAVSDGRRAAYRHARSAT